ncbi:helix-turn-helix domain-containing protein [Paenibacillus sp. GCM10023250]|uniref:helix-turn-helix domain-containing protein n=1 Tax=Paenibacillus sp. GCM10023250 TaxID=3252648 RepID=UPI0036152484
MYKVLVADDEPLMIEGWKTMVDWQACGYELCGTATDGEEAIAAIRACPPDLVMTDIRMPVLDGLGLIRAMKEELGLTAKTVIVSGYSEFGYAQQALRYQVDHYLLKPLVPEEVHQVLRELAGPLAERRREEASAGRERDAAAAEAVAAALRHGGPAALEAAGRLLGANARTRCRLLLAETLAGSSGGEAAHVRLRRLLEAAFPAGLRTVAFAEAPGRGGLLVLDEHETGGDFEARLAEAAERLPDAFAGLAAYASERGEGLAALPALYGQALEARRHALLGRRAGLHLYRRPGRATEGDCRLPDVAAGAERLLRAVEAGDAAAVRAALDPLHGLFARCGAKDEWARLAAQHIRGALLRRDAAGLAEAGGPGPDGPGLDGAGGAPAGPRAPLPADGAAWDRETLEALCLRAAASFAERRSARDCGGAVADAVAYLNGHFREKVLLQELAERFRLSPVYFGQQFKKATGYPFHDYVHRLRIDEARKLLRRTDMKISAIAGALGYHDTEYFTGKFKAFTGELPSAYKNKIKGEGHAER